MSCRSSLSFTSRISTFSWQSLCVLGFAEPFLDPADGFVVVGVPLHRGRQPQVRQRLTESAGPLQSPAEHVVRVVVRWIMLDQGPELGLGAGQLRGVEVRAGQQLAYGGVVRLGLDDRLEQAGRTERVA